jgi:hypothetical protein
MVIVYFHLVNRGGTGTDKPSGAYEVTKAL